MSKYSDIVKKSLVQTEPVVSEEKGFTVVDKKPYVYRCQRPPPKRGNCNYDRWEYAYFAYLTEMYRTLFESSIGWDPPAMYQFFQFIYYVSSGEICKHLEKLTEEQQEAYFEYQIKRNN